jgi:hypothetical protein
MKTNLILAANTATTAAILAKSSAGNHTYVQSTALEVDISHWDEEEDALD